MGFFFCSFFKQIETRTNTTDLNYMSLENNCYRYIISTASLQASAQEILPNFQGQFNANICK